MDPISQGVIGAIAAQIPAKKDTIRKAAFCGLIGGLFPDIDVIIKSNTDPLLALEYHRHFTHALFMAPVVGLVVAAMLYIAFFRKSLSFNYVYLFSTLGVLSHGILDAFTNYGTYLLWPFSSERIGWNLISIIDPLFTIPLLLLVLTACALKCKKVAFIAPIYAVFYLSLNAYQHIKIDTFVEDLATQRGHTIERSMINASFGNNVLWRSVYQSGDTYYVDAVRYTPWDGYTLYQGNSVPVYTNTLPKGTTIYKDINRFAHFAMGYLQKVDGYEHRVGDLRYSVLPHNTRPIFAIDYNPENPSTHVQFVNMRENTGDVWNTFKAMVLGTLQK